MTKEMIEIEKKKIAEIPAIWDEGINTVAKKWLNDKEAEKICPIKKYKEYLASGNFKWYCVDICYRLFLRARMHRTCPCKILELEEVKSKVRAVIKEWERKKNEKRKEGGGKKNVIGDSGSLDAHFTILETVQGMAESPGPVMSRRQKVVRDIMETENK